MRLTKEEFIKYMNTFKEMWDKSTEIYKALGIYGEFYLDEMCSNYYNLISDMCDFEENEDTRKYGTTLDYFCYDLDFGKEYSEGCFTIDDVDIPLKTVEDCYDAIISELSTQTKEEGK